MAERAAGSKEGKGPPRVALVDTGVNPWHSHVRGRVEGLRLYADASGRIREDGEFFDPVGHGTAVAGVLRQELPEAEIFAVRVFGEAGGTYPALVARGILSAAAAGAEFINLSLALASGAAGEEVLRDACRAALDAGCRLVASGRPGEPGLLPASVDGVLGVLADDSLPPGEVRFLPDSLYPYRARGLPRDLDGLPPGANLWGHSFACARVTAHLAGRAGR